MKRLTEAFANQLEPDPSISIGLSINGYGLRFAPEAKPAVFFAMRNMSRQDTRFAIVNFMDTLVDRIFSQVVYNDMWREITEAFNDITEVGYSDFWALPIPSTQLFVFVGIELISEDRMNCDFAVSPDPFRTLRNLMIQNGGVETNNRTIH